MAQAVARVMAEANNDIGYGDGDDDSHNHH